MKRYRIERNQDIELNEWPADDCALVEEGKEAGRAKTDKFLERLDALQEVLHAEGKHKVLVILQGMDTSGKDGLIRRVFSAVDPQGVRIASFKRPSEEELAHDYLWRVHKQVPGKGEMVVFNRSHYEDVLVVRVHKLVPKEVWSKRFDQINEFERMLVENGTTVLKFFLHISAEEQRQRLQARLDEPDKRWKFNPGDLGERKLWDQYMEAFADVLRKTSTKWAPWHLVPADRKWYRDYLVSRVLVDALEKLDMKYPEVDVSGIVIE